MLRMDALRLLISERLAAAVEEICGAVEMTITQEVSCLQQEIARLHRAAADPRPYLVPEETPHEQRHHKLRITPRPVKEDLMEFAPLEDEEDLGSSDTGDQLQEEEMEADFRDFIFSPACVMSGHDRDQTRSPNLQISVEIPEEDEIIWLKTAEGSQTPSPVNKDDPVAQRSNNESNNGLAVKKIHGPQLAGQAGQQVVTQIILRRVSTPATDAGQTPQEAGAQGRDQVKLTVAQLDELTQGAQKLMVQGQGGRTTGQLQVIPPGVDVACGPGQELMQATLPDGQVQRFLFTSMLPAASSSTGQAGKPVVTQIKLTLTQLTQWTQGQGGKITPQGVNVTRGPGQEHMLATPTAASSTRVPELMTRGIRHHAVSAHPYPLTPNSTESPRSCLCCPQDDNTKWDTGPGPAPTGNKLNRWWGKKRKRSWIEQVNHSYPCARRPYRGTAAWRMLRSQMAKKAAKIKEQATSEVATSEVETSEVETSEAATSQTTTSETTTSTATSAPATSETRTSETAALQ